MESPPSRIISINRHNHDFIRFFNKDRTNFLSFIESLVPFSVKQKYLSTLHAAEFRWFPPASPYRVFHLGNCKPSLGHVTQRMCRESYGFHLRLSIPNTTDWLQKWPQLSPEKQTTATTSEES